MSKERSAMKVKLNSFYDLFGANAPAASDQIVNVALSELYTFQNHPFKVNDDKEMEELAESIRQHGVLMPGKTEMPVIIRGYTDDGRYQYPERKYPTK